MVRKEMLTDATAWLILENISQRQILYDPMYVLQLEQVPDTEEQTLPKAERGSGVCVCVWGLFNEHGVSVWDDDKFIEMGNNDHCKRAWMQLRP